MYGSPTSGLRGSQFLSFFSTLDVFGLYWSYGISSGYLISVTGATLSIYNYMILMYDGIGILYMEHIMRIQWVLYFWVEGLGLRAYRHVELFDSVLEMISYVDDYGIDQFWFDLEYV